MVTTKSVKRTVKKPITATDTVANVETKKHRIVDTVIKPKTIPKLHVKLLSEPKTKLKKIKLVRDSFTIPDEEYQVLTDVKKAFLKTGLKVKKSELLRVGIALMHDMDFLELKMVVANLTPIKAKCLKKTIEY